MREWERELYVYTVNPAPPKMVLQEYIKLYCAEKEEKYLSWFLHYYEPALNRNIMGLVQEYAMQGHFMDMKSAYVLGLLKALESYDNKKGAPFLVYKEYHVKRAIDDYIRTSRIGFTVQSDDEYFLLRKAMALYERYDRKNDDNTIARIAEELQRKPEDVREILQGGMRNMLFMDFYRCYADEDSEESAEDVTADHASEPFNMLMCINEKEAIRAAFENLDYRERMVVSAHLGFCPECFSTKFMDKNDLNENDNPKKKNIRPQVFIDIAYDHALSSPVTADRIYRGAIGKMREYYHKNQKNLINLIECSVL